MHTRDEFFRVALRQTEPGASLLSGGDADNIRSQIERIHAFPGSKSLWQRLVRSRGVQCEDCMNRACRTFACSPAYLFFDVNETRDVWCFDNGNEVERVLSACPPTEFYLASMSCEVLLCCNHHDYLIASGPTDLQ